MAGGNYLPFLSRNVGGHGQAVSNIEELQPSATQNALDEQCDPLDGADDGMLNYPFGGHGTHVAGLVGANGIDGSGVRGACVRCGMVSVRRSWTYCANDNGPKMRVGVTGNVDGEGLEHMYKVGAQVVNMSFSNAQDPCFKASNNRVCNAISEAYWNDILMVASAGNARTSLNFPANDPRVASAGGLGVSNAFWDESPGSTTYCPNGNDLECGSNFTSSHYLQSRQEGVTPAKSVRSVFYPGITWSTKFKCGDEFGDGAANDGEGLCTGTSMSAPELAGLYGLLRSVNPVMRAGDPINQTGAPYFMPDGIREVVAQTTDRAVLGQGEDVKLGFGIPNADRAVQLILGKVRNKPVRNRVTPLFGMYSPGSNDYATFANPQAAMASLLYSTNAYRSVPIAGDTFIPGASIAGYAAFPNPAAGQPRARAMVLTTEQRPLILTANYPSPVPLVLLEKKRQGPSACDMSSPQCHGDSVIALESQVQTAVNGGYSYAGLQGYVYPQCTPEATCMPVGTQYLHVKCTSGAAFDCAAFLEGDRPSFEAAGYVNTFLGAPSSIIGYAYPAGDADSDGMVDAMERVVGTSTSDTDSDDDGLLDSTEYPLTGVSNTDPCSGPNITCAIGMFDIFANGFE